MRLRRERKAAGLTQVELARLADVPQSSVSKLERGDILAPTFGTLHRLARALNKCGRDVDPGHLQPRRRPELVKGALVKRRALA